MHNINLSFVFGLRTIGKEHSAARKLCSAINANFPSKTAFRCLEKKLEHVFSKVACKIMNETAVEVHKKNNFDEVIQCSVSVDRTWQRRGHLFLNGCVSVISIDTGEIVSLKFRIRNKIETDERPPEPARIRTWNLLIRSEARYPLRHCPI
ncbi:uncharacterized protein TNIN_129491 [Trichonephila inaurata madagascariensis]|uniref:Mutator-like transposase domain-containing protein n=1 Tax=Trichonephila inaurata madagascariensis TaxID=2747483 RepID=A0A8X6WT46_9ARAC|nr:uncharacterized protein TNIN_129491 [Trichonephila inaurata madagascariensis]